MLRRVTPKLSGWWLDYIENPELDCPIWNKVFQQRLELPYLTHCEVLEWMSGNRCDGLFDRWRTDADGLTGQKSNKKVSPIEHLLLGTLRYLGWGWTFNDIEVGRCIAVYFARVHDIWRNFCTRALYKCPQTTADLRNCESEYAVAGFPRCIGSTNATHIPLGKITASFWQADIGASRSRRQQLEHTI